MTDEFKENLRRIYGLTWATITQGFQEWPLMTQGNVLAAVFSALGYEDGVLEKPEDENEKSA